MGSGHHRVVVGFAERVRTRSIQRHVQLAAVALLASFAATAQQTQQQVEQYDEADELALREYVDVRINALELSMLNGFSTSKEAVEKSDRATELRFDSVNEFRSQLNDQQRTFLPRLEYEQAHAALINRVNELTERVSAREARSEGMGDVWPILFGIIGVVGIVFGIFMAIRKAEPAAAIGRP